MSEETTNAPVETLRDGAVKATIWRKEGRNGAFFHTVISRTYKDDQDRFQDSYSLSGTAILKASRLALKAYDRARELEAAEKIAGRTDNGEGQS